MVKRRVSKASKRRLVIFGTISFIVIGYFIYSLCLYTYNLDRLNKEDKNLKSELSDLKEKEKYLKTEIEKLNDPEYIARFAREKYQYTKDGEIVIQMDEEEKKSATKVSNLSSQYIYIGGISLFIIFVLYLIVKKV